jgi:hypothetical protein
MNLNYRRAALLSCHHAAWQSRANHPPVTLPSRMRPLHRDVAADLFGRSTSPEDKRARSNALAILQTAPGTRNLSLLSPADQAQLSDALDKAQGDTAQCDQAQGDKAKRCAWCDLQAAHDKVSGLPPPPTIVKHDLPSITFNSDRMITEVTTSVEAKVSPEDANRLLLNADPRRWKTAAADFFTASDPGIYENGTWTPKPWPDETGGLLREMVHWSWNGDDEVSVDNILSIEGLEIKKNSIKYTYSLYTCLQSRLLIVWDSGGLDIDAGHYTANYDPSDGSLKIEASKSVRFTVPASGPFEISLALNLMAPATISMLMQKLVNVSCDHQDGTDKRGDR